MTGVFSLTKVALSLLSLGGTFGGGSFGLMTLLEGEKQTSQRASLVETTNSGSEQTPSKELVSENSEQPKRIQKRSVDSPKPWTNTEYFYVERKDGEVEVSCEKLRPNQLFTDYVEPWMCDWLFNKSTWKESVGNSSQGIFRINGDGAFNTLSYYFGLGERKNDEQFKEELKKGISLKNFECKSGEEKDGKLIVTCIPKTVSEQS